jgi:hypothetical protein
LQQVICGGCNVWTIATHDHAVRVFVTVCQYAGIPATDRFITPLATLDPDPNGKITRQTGDIMVCRQGFQKEMLDVRLSHPVNVDVRNGNYVEKGEANKKASQEKIRKHGEKCIDR